jgi:hypothetical protein
VEKELCRLALRHFEDDSARTAKFLGISSEEVRSRADQHAPPAAASPAKKPGGKKTAA